MPFTPNYNHLLDVLKNKRPARLPLYEHIISPKVMEKIMGISFSEMIAGGQSELTEYFSCYCRFFREMTYDTVSYEVCITEILPDRGAILGGRPGPIQNRADFNKYPWDDLPQLYWDVAAPKFEALGECLPAGMKAIGGVGNGAFEISEDLVGFEYLSYMQVDDPDLMTDLYRRIGDLMYDIWETFLKKYAHYFCACRFGDDLGFKSGLLIQPHQLRKHIFPQYKRIIELIHRYRRQFLWHSCGNIFEIMDDVIRLGIDAKHSNEDIIAPFEKWILSYGNRIGLLGGIDVDILCQHSAGFIHDYVAEHGMKYRNMASGFALGSGNSIPDYVPMDGFLAMIEAARHIREHEK